MTTPEDRDRILRLWRSGVPSSHIARRLGVGRREVNGVIREWEGADATAGA